jgi:hypothetical protein
LGDERLFGSWSQAYVIGIDSLKLRLGTIFHDAAFEHGDTSSAADADTQTSANGSLRNAFFSG